jgi:hypothetical protein
MCDQSVQEFIFQYLTILWHFMVVIQELSAELLRGFVECLESEEPEDVLETEDEFVGEFTVK